MKKSSRNWSIEEDKMLLQTIMQSNGSRKLKWEQVADIMHEKIVNCQKTGKQCRERWHNHLAPELNNSGQWTKEENQILFKYHAQLGNKWAKIATFLKGRTDNCVKNHFYSTLRRGMRIVNNFIHQYRKKDSIKQFKTDVLTKILIVADGDPQQKLNAKNNAVLLSRNIKLLLIEVSLAEDEDTYDEVTLDKVIELIMEFNKNCKKRKGKKKGPATERISKEQQMEEQDEISEEQEEIVKYEGITVKQENIEEYPQAKIKNKEYKEKDKQREKQKQKQNNDEKMLKKQQNTKEVEQKLKQKQTLKTKSYKQANNGSKNIQEKDDLKQIDQISQNQPQILKEQFQKNIGKVSNKILRVGSFESLPSEPLNPNNFSGSFYMANYGNGEFQIQKLFKSSGFGLSFPVPEHNPPSAKEIFADSGLGIKRNQALFHLSGLSMSGMSGGDQRNSFFNLTNDKGVIQTQDLINSKQLEKYQQSQANKKTKSSRNFFSNSFNGNSSNVFSRLQFSGSMFKNYIPDIHDIQTEKVTKEEGFAKKE